MSRIALALALLMLAAPLLAGPEGEKARLEQLNFEIEEREARAREYADEAQEYLGELESIDRELTEARARARALRARLGTAERDLGAVREQLEVAEAALRKTEGDLELRLVALYKIGAPGALVALYTARDFQTFLLRRSALGRILEEDSRLFEAHRLARGRWLESREKSEAIVSDLRRARRELGHREQVIRSALVARKNLVALLRSRSDRERRAAGELREAAVRLERALARLPRDFQPASGRGLVPGRLSRPVAGRLRLPFGRVVDPEFGTETLRNGVEFAVARGGPVRAVADGRVLFAGWFRGYGQIVILDHGDGSVTVSGYLDEVSAGPGDNVSQGAIIGTVGDTGSLSGPGLYFEIRHQGKPVDPETWLASDSKEGR